jgi:diguanylate cyclase (GGDEF)-like protein
MKQDSFTLELIRLLKSGQGKSSEAIKTICYELLEHSIRKRDYKGQICALFYLGELRFRQHKYKHSLEYLLKGMELLGSFHDSEQMIVYCNLIGIIYSKLGDEQKAFDYYFIGMDLASEKKDFLWQARFYSNIASAYAKLSAHEEALKNFFKEKHCYQHLLRDENHRSEYPFLCLKLNINIGLTFCALQRYKQAYPILQEVEQQNIVLYEEYLLSYYALKIKIFFGIRKVEESMTYVKLFYERAVTLPDILDNFDDCYDIFFELLQVNAVEDALNYLELLSKTALEIGVEGYQSKYYDALLQFNIRHRSRKEFMNSFESFLAVEEQKEKEFRLMKLTNLRDKQLLESTAELKRLTKQNMSVMKEKSEKDALTKLANRYYLNEYCEEKFTDAIVNNLTIGIDVIDIDYFKQYNDTFGHLYGDNCLIQVADAMREAAGNHFLARFGGDEFFIIFYNTSTEEILEVANRLKNILQSKRILQAQGLPYDFITISQGIVNEVPREGQTISDFVHSADSALYKGKKLSKNSIYLGDLS